ncbi:MAG: hypothetical protein Q8O86_04985 [Dehalococcoidia bacterium]|nr:hypothetical protein [Dehalococcoidia bacterium]
MKEEAMFEAQRRRRAYRKATIIGFQVFIGLALLIAVVGGLWDQAQQPPVGGAVAVASNAAGIPAQIAGLRRTETMTGPQALAELQELHGKDVGVAGGWIAHYGKEATVWMGEARDEATAIQLLEAMTRRIQAGNQYFTGLKQLQVEGRPVFTVVGQGQRHYYYRQGRQLIWLAVPNGREDDFLKEALLAIK